MATASYAETIAARGLGHPKRRAELADALFDAGDALVRTAEGLREALVCHLENPLGTERDVAAAVFLRTEGDLT